MSRALRRSRTPVRSAGTPPARDAGAAAPRRLRVAVLMGGPSPEREVSLWSGAQVVAALDPARFEVFPVEITRAGKWLPRPDLLRLPAPAERPEGERGPAASDVALPSDLPGAAGPPVRLDQPPDAAPKHIDEVVGDGAVDVAFIALHGPYGEDGTVQGLLELLGIPYTGSGVLASALAMDKLRSRQVLQANGIAVPAYVAVEDDAWPDRRGDVAARVARDLGYPCVVKPNAVGSSIGVEIVGAPGDLAAAVGRALGYGTLALVEEYLRGTELTCAILDDPETGAPRALPVVEIVPKREFFDYEAKYRGASDEIVPARIPAPAAERVQQAALRVHGVLGCEGFSRVDLFLAGGNVVVLEANTIPGMTRGSLIPLAARAAGIEFPALVCRVVEDALRRARGSRRRAGRVQGR